VDSFIDFKLNKQLLNAVAEMGYTKPTAIQEKAIPAILGGQDVMGIAQTGTGKTAAYLLPLLRILNYPQGDTPRALILVPTRELSIQVGKTIEDLAKYTGIRHAVVFGGAGAKEQIASIKKGIDILVASPGRFLDLYLEGHIIPKKIKHLVVDEAERLMDKSFMGQFHRILEVIPQKRQNLLFSATMSDLVKKISGDFLDFPIQIHITPEVRTAETVSQEYYKIPNLRTKLNLLEFFLKDEEEFRKVIVFCKTKVIATNIGKYMERLYGLDNVKIVHGNKTQQTRIHAMEAFRSSPIRILVCTDLAARGLDVPDVSHVINFDTPIVYEDYVHRIGRTGRAFKTGKSITFVSPADEYHLKKISRLIKQTIPETKIPQQVKVVETEYEERQEIAREIDRQKHLEDPDYQGAFHVKKNANVIVERKEKRTAPLSKIKSKNERAEKNLRSASSRKPPRSK
jgi:ATP-dependent RNA helicase RhlE